ncbi:NAD-dependent epimerase/dehydratase family protein [Streptomyces rubiginosohelvolus]|uniref:NAD-dependent epimerase/dehydratase family protein n=1 Tax=Streptomyces TaxID=1883 RepID=UPI00190CB789|nr:MULTISPECIES: NAD-dependent epimerase/dehydratase family protein [unclassified Streptomyces]MBK3529220.1 NAD-dependent epimerase/dehydratase family protein [Streptomyces sp. MBT72]MBK3535591.1 NAD-dependent epimerase/dehydratase family protein [Streptomyces sp. MBT67]MBK3549485.1 NAD-dependent epimerase/dehydratase family protein [Streptomyces sp. MBT61]MBK6028340.1 NAD-dependent epimerase/dehydratase family protein [Streptomyces sp. MBT59]
MQIVITGGAGFIGGNLVRALTEQPQVTRLRVVDNLSTGDKANLAGLDVDFFEGDVQDAALLDQAFHGAEAVVHLAALPSVPRSIRDPLASHHANATGTLQVLEAARRAGGPHVIAASSSSVYGSNPHLPKHEDLATAPMSPYAVTKLTTEAYLSAYHHSFDLPVLPFRFFNVYGPGQRADHAYAAVIPKWISATLAGEPVTIHGDGTQTRDFTYVGTICHVLIDALLRRLVEPRPVNLAFGTRISLLDLIPEIETASGRLVRREHLSDRVGDVPHSQADSSHLRALFPTVAPATLEEGVSATVDWFRTSVISST